LLPEAAAQAVEDVQFRKGFGEIGERARSSRAPHAIRPAIARGIYFSSALSFNADAKHKSVDGTRVALREDKDPTMKRKQWIMSLVVFAVIIGGLVSIDPRVRDQFMGLVSGGDGIATWDDRALDLGNAIAGAIRHQSIDNAPVLLFATVGVVLFVFMVRT
jgi:hypothetical protein